MSGHYSKVLDIVLAQWVNLDFSVWVDAVGAGAGENWKAGERRGERQLSSYINVTQWPHWEGLG